MDDGTESIAVWIAAGLYDPAAAQAEERLELLRWIVQHDVTVEQMIAAERVNQLIGLVGELRLRPGRRYSIIESAGATGLPIDSITTIRRASGFPDVPTSEPVYVEADLQMFQQFAFASELFSERELTHFVRVVGGSLRRIAEAAGEMFIRDIEVGLSAAGSQLDSAKANVAAFDMVQTAAAIFEPLFRNHLEYANQATRAALAGSLDHTEVPLTVGFIDLNGFTAQSSSMSTRQLLDLVVSFEALAVDLVAAHGGRLVKLIGDEVMFSAVDCTEACTIASALVEAISSWGYTACGGLAHGRVIASGGDVYGEVVNLAARSADIAIPGEVLVNEAVTLSARGRTFDSAGRRQLKGFSKPIQLWSLRSKT